MDDELIQTAGTVPIVFLSVQIAKRIFGFGGKAVLLVVLLACLGTAIGDVLVNESFTPATVYKILAKTALMFTAAIGSHDLASETSKIKQVAENIGDRITRQAGDKLEAAGERVADAAGDATEEFLEEHIPGMLQGTATKQDVFDAEAAARAKFEIPPPGQAPHTSAPLVVTEEVVERLADAVLKRMGTR